MLGGCKCYEKKKSRVSWEVTGSAILDKVVGQPWPWWAGGAGDRATGTT